MASRRKAKPTPPASPLPTPEALARRTLAIGAGTLIAGLALVGIGYDGAGVVPALGGLLVLVYGIHTFGRLGPVEDAPAEEEPREAVERDAWAGIWLGGLIAGAGVAVTFGSPAGQGWGAVIAYLAMFAGGFRLVRGLSGLSRARKG